MTRLDDIRQRVKEDEACRPSTSRPGDRAYLLDLVERAEGIVFTASLESPLWREPSEWLDDVRGEEKG